MTTYDYSSTQVNLPKQQKEQFLKFGRELVRPSVLYDPKDHGYGGDVPHVTVLFGLHDQMPPLELTEFIKGYPKFTVTLGKVSLFNTEEFDVVKVDIDCPDLHVLNAEISEMMPNSQDFPEYIPHATLAYVKIGSCDHLKGIDTLKGMSFVPDTLSFSNVAGRRIHIPFGRQ